MIHTDVLIEPETLAAFCRKHRIRRLGFFGSVLRDDFGPQSDVDVLYEFQPDVRLGWDIINVEEELSRLLGGRTVDFVPVTNLNHRLRDLILDSAEWSFVDEG
jgi:uncharacterized protein